MKLFFLVVMAAAATQAAPEQSHCNERCKDQKEGEGLVDACQRGCDMFLAKDAAERNIFVNPFTALQRTDSRAALIKCTNDCNLSYHDNEASSCADGCRWQSEVPTSRGPGTVLNFGDGGLTITLGAMPEMPRMPQGLSNLFSQVNDMVNDQIRVQHAASNPFWATTTHPSSPRWTTPPAASAAACLETCSPPCTAVCRT